jgi:hypothetical protein
MTDDNLTDRRPLIGALVTFLATENGGRRFPPVMGIEAKYMPHIVVQPASVRHVTLNADRTSQDTYRGVCFVDGPRIISLGQPGQYTLELMYWPRNVYADVIPGAEFTVREGGRIVGYGHVIDRVDPT